MAKTYVTKSNNKSGTLVQTGTIDMYYEIDGEGEVLLLLHGFGGCCQNWHPFIPFFSDKYRVINVDLRGHGFSTNPENIFTHQQASEDVFELLNYLKIHQFSAMGMSTGGMVLLHMAVKMPERIKAMVLISATTHFPEQARAIMRRVSFDTMPPEVREMYGACAKHGKEQIEQLIKQFNAFHTNFSDMNFTPQTLSEIQARTLIVHGEKDNFFPVEIAENLHHSIPLSELWIIPNGVHVPIFDQVESFSEKAISFLNEPLK